MARSVTEKSISPERDCRRSGRRFKLHVRLRTNMRAGGAAGDPSPARRPCALRSGRRKVDDAHGTRGAPHDLQACGAARGGSARSSAHVLFASRDARGGAVMTSAVIAVVCPVGGVGRVEFHRI